MLDIFIIYKKINMDFVSVGASLGIGLAVLGVAIGQGFFITKVMDIFGKNPKMTPYFLTLSILGVALVESAAVYGLVVALKILSTNFSDSLVSIGVGFSIGLTGLGVGIGEGLIIKSSIEAINKFPEYKNKIISYMILFVALIESSAIYGIIIAFDIFSKTDISGFVSIGAGLAIGLTGLGVSIGEGLIGRKTMDVIGENGLEGNKIIIPFTILGIALVESCAIYGLIVSLNILNLDFAKGLFAIGAGLAIGLTGLGVAIGEGLLISKAVSKTSVFWLNGKILIPVTVLGVALVESSAIYGLTVAFQLLNETNNFGLNGLGAGLAIGLAGLGVGLAEGYLGYMALETISINRVSRTKVTTYMVLFIAMIESCAIYGLVLAFNLIGVEQNLGLAGIGVGLAIGLAGIGVAIGESILSGKSLNLIGKRPQLSNFFVTVTILGIAMVESASIYALITSFQIISKNLETVVAIGVGLIVGLSGFGVGISEGFIVSGAFGAIARNPEYKTRFLTFMILFIALVEVLAIYGLIIAFQILK